MTRNQVEVMLHAEPFQPFRVVTSSGRVYQVRHPENVLMLRDSVHIAYYGEAEEGRDAELPDRAAVVSWLHISSLEPVDSAKAA